MPGEDEELSYPTLHTSGVSGRPRKRFGASEFRVHNFNNFRAHNYLGFIILGFIAVGFITVGFIILGFIISGFVMILRFIGFRHRGCLGFKILSEGLRACDRV